MATCKLITSDGAEVTLLESNACRFITLKNVIECIAGDDAIPLPSISWPTLNALLTYLNYFIENNDPMLDFTGFDKNEREQTKEEQDLYYKWAVNKKFLDGWETEFYNKFDDEALFKLWVASDYLNCPFLMDSFRIEIGMRVVRGLGKPFNTTF
jgi:hypothetical protein